MSNSYLLSNDESTQKVGPTVLNIYLISQSKNVDYDTYDQAVVCAHDEDEARHIHPRLGKFNSKPDWWLDDSYDGSWALPEYVTVRLIGKADASITAPCVICASFNAG